MARRDLSRTVIEGGRYRSAKFLRRAHNAAGRAREREWLDGVRVDPELADEHSIVHTRKRFRWFYDKLAVPRRWLRKQCGRPWDKVFSELMDRFDTRTVAGRHILFDHMLRDVRGAIENDEWRTYSFEIDDHGILRKLPSWRELHKKIKPPSWTQGNSAVLISKTWWWVGDRLLGPCKQPAKCRYLHRRVDGVDRHYTPGTRLRVLTPTEVGRLTSLPPRVREVVLWRGRVLEPEEAPLAVPSS